MKQTRPRVCQIGVNSKDCLYCPSSNLPCLLANIEETTQHLYAVKRKNVLLVKTHFLKVIHLLRLWRIMHSIRKFQYLESIINLIVENKKVCLYIHTGLQDCMQGEIQQNLLASTGVLAPLQPKLTPANKFQRTCLRGEGA